MIEPNPKDPSRAEQVVESHGDNDLAAAGQVYQDPPLTGEEIVDELHGVDDGYDEEGYPSSAYDAIPDAAAALSERGQEWDALEQRLPHIYEDETIAAIEPMLASLATIYDPTEVYSPAVVEHCYHELGGDAHFAGPAEERQLVDEIVNSDRPGGSHFE
jgi:hypothetical protein